VKPENVCDGLRSPFYSQFSTDLKYVCMLYIAHCFILWPLNMSDVRPHSTFVEYHVHIVCFRCECIDHRTIVYRFAYWLLHHAVRTAHIVLILCAFTHSTFFSLHVLVALSGATRFIFFISRAAQASGTVFLFYLIRLLAWDFRRQPTWVCLVLLLRMFGVCFGLSAGFVCQ